MAATKHRFHAHRSEGHVHACPECHGTGRHEATIRCIHCSGTGEVVTPLTRDDRLALGRLCTRDDGGQHFLAVTDQDWLARMEDIGLITIHRPVHDQTGIPYSGEYWSVEVANEVDDWFDDHGQLIEA